MMCANSRKSSVINFNLLKKDSLQACSTMKNVNITKRVYINVHYSTPCGNAENSKRTYSELRISFWKSLMCEIKFT